MPTASLQEVYEALADQIQGVLELATDIDIQVEPLPVISATPPTIDLIPADPPNDVESAAFGELSGGDFITVRARVSTADPDAGWGLLIQLMDKYSDLSVAAAIMDDVTLNGLASLDVTGPTGAEQYPDPGGEGALLGCRWTVLAIRMDS